MSRHFLIALALLLGGCATYSGNTYYSSTGDYYYGAATADVVVDDGPFYSGFFGYPGGYGYAGLYSPWFYGYWPIWWSADPPQFDSDDLRHARVEQDRVQRSALAQRPTIRAPESSRWSRPESSTLPSRSGLQARATAGVGPFTGLPVDSTSANSPPARTMGNVVPVSKPPQRTLQMSAPAPMRVAPPPASRSSTSRRQ